MKAVVIDKVTPAEDIRLVDVPIPEVIPGWVLVKIKAFGLNYSEKLLRISRITHKSIKKPLIPGTECAGLIIDPSDSSFKKGDKVIAFMGGMGRQYDGSYAEYALLPADHVFHVDSDLEWPEIAAVPKTYFTAMGALFGSLKIRPEDTLLIRGATCAMGYVALQIAKTVGCKVIAATQREEKFGFLEDADVVIPDDGRITGKVFGANKAIDLIGPKSLIDTLTAVEPGGIVCCTALIGGVYSIEDFNPLKDIPNGVYLTGFDSDNPTQKDVDNIFVFLDQNNLSPSVGAVYDFTNIREALMDLDSVKTNGKIVVMMEDFDWG